MKEFERSDEYMSKIIADALGSEVHLDMRIDFVREGAKVRAYCRQLDSNLQFPRHLRRPGSYVIADIIRANSTGATFYRAYRGSIRTPDGEIVA